MEVYAFYNEKGGVGKTTSTLATLSYFNSPDFFKKGEGKKALAIDMDPQRSMTLLSGAKPKSGCMILDVLTDETNIKDAVTETVFGDIIATNRELMTIDSQMDVDAADTVSKRKEVEENLLTLRKKVRELEGLYDYVILDCPPGFANIAMSCMVAADALISGKGFKGFVICAVVRFADGGKGTEVQSRLADCRRFAYSSQRPH